MRFYTTTHRHYCGIDLHAKNMSACILSQEGKVLLHRNLRTEPDLFLRSIAPYREDLVVGVECMFTWYRLADLCAQEGIHFVLGHALYMKAIHGGKANNDCIDAYKIAVILRGGMLPCAYVYPAEWRSNRDLLRRRLRLVRQRGQLMSHVQNTHHQYNLPLPKKRIAYRANREGVAEQFTDVCARKSIEVDLELTGHYDDILRDLELYLTPKAKVHDQDAFFRLRSVPGNVKRKALSILAHRLGRTVYYLLKKKRTFSMDEFLKA